MACPSLESLVMDFISCLQVTPRKSFSVSFRRAIRSYWRMICFCDGADLTAYINLWDVSRIVDYFRDESNAAGDLPPEFIPSISVELDLYRCGVRVLSATVNGSSDSHTLNKKKRPCMPLKQDHASGSAVFLVPLSQLIR